MEKTMLIDGIEVPFRASAAIPRLYRIKFRRDIIQDMTELQKAMSKAKEAESSLPPQALELFENVAYIMAKHADKEGVPNSAEDWLDRFNTFSIYEIFPEIIALWDLNMEGFSSGKKK